MNAATVNRCRLRPKVEAPEGPVDACVITASRQAISAPALNVFFTGLVGVCPARAAVDRRAPTVFRSESPSSTVPHVGRGVSCVRCQCAGHRRPRYRASPTRWTRAANRLSERRTSNNGSTFSSAICQSLASTAFSSHSKARSISPRPMCRNAMRTGAGS